MVPSTMHRVLIAEDEGMTVMLLRRALTAAGFEVVGAVANGEAAVQQVEALQPDFIMMDVNMPLMNGIEATRQIMAKRRLPVIILTAYPDEELVQEAIEAGACAYLVKPITGEQLLPAIRMSLARFEASENIQNEYRELKQARLDAQAETLMNAG